MVDPPTTPNQPSLTPDPSDLPKPNSRFVMPPWLKRKTVVPLAGLVLLVGVLGMGTYLVQQNQNLGTSARKKETHVSPRVIELSDNFDGVTLDTTKWSVNGTELQVANAVTQAGGSVHFSTGEVASSYKSAGIGSATFVSGNYSFEVTVSNLSKSGGPTDSTSVAWTSLVLANDQGNDYNTLVWYVRGNGEKYVKLYNTLDGTTTAQSSELPVPASVTSLKLKLTREGTTLAGFVHLGGEYQLVGSIENAYSGEGNIQMDTFADPIGGLSASASYDNFSSRVTIAGGAQEAGGGETKREAPSGRAAEGEMPTSGAGEGERVEHSGARAETPTSGGEGAEESVGGGIETAAMATCSQAAFSDTFAQEIRTEQWQKIRPNGAIVARSGEQVVITVPKRNSDNAGRLSTKKLISGDFQIEVDVLSLQSSGANTDATAELLLEGESLGQVHIARRKGAGYDQLETNARRPDGTWGDSVRIDASGMGLLRFRIVRMGRTLRTYYKRVGGDFVQLGEFSDIYSGEGWVQLMAFSLVDHPAVNATFDNFSLRCPENLVFESDAETLEEHETIVQASPTTEFGGLSGPLRSETSVVASARPETGGESARGGEQRGQSQFVPESGLGVRASERPRSSSAPESGRSEARGQERRGIVERVREFFSNILGIFRER